MTAGLRPGRAMTVQGRGHRGTLPKGLSAGDAADPAGSRGTTAEDSP